MHRFWLPPLIVLAIVFPAPAQPAHRDLKQDAVVTALVFSPDGKTLASAGDDRTVRVWDLAAGTVRHHLRGHEGTVSCLACSGDGKTLASGGRDGVICLWDMAAGKLLRRCTGHGRTVLSLSFAPDSRLLASASYDQTVRLWEVRTGQSQCQVEAHADAVSCISFSPDGRTLASGGHDAAVRVWSVSADGKTIRPLHHLRDSRRSEITGLTFCLGGRLLASVTTQGTIRLRDPARGEELRLVGIPDSSVLTLACSADGRTLAAAGLGGRLGLCEVATGGLVFSRDERAAETNHLKFSPTEGFPGEVRGLALSATGLTVAAGTKAGDILVRDVGRALLGREAPARLADKDLETLWSELRDPRSSVAYRAVALFAARPESSVPFLRQQLKPVVPPQPARIEKLLEDLDHARFSTREKAAAELERGLDTAEPLLRRRLQGQPPLEMRRRIERLLQPLDERVPPPDRLRVGRAVQVLEQVGSTPARALLEYLAGGAPAAWLTEEARQALARLRLVGS